MTSACVVRVIGCMGCSYCFCDQTPDGNLPKGYSSSWCWGHDNGIRRELIIIHAQSGHRAQWSQAFRLQDLPQISHLLQQSPPQRVPNNYTNRSMLFTFHIPTMDTGSPHFLRLGDIPMWLVCSSATLFLGFFVTQHLQTVLS